MRTLEIVLLAAVLLLGGCQFVTPPPEVRVSAVAPISYEVMQSSSGGYFDASVTLEITNNVEAVVTGYQVGYYDIGGENSIGSKSALIAMNAEFSSELDLSSLPVYISPEMITHMYGEHANAVVRLFFTGEDAYGYEKEFDADIDIGIFALDL
jgi:hypothetical protein